MNRKKIMIGMVTHRINQGNKGVLIVSSRKFHRANMLKIHIRAIEQIDEGIVSVSDYPVCSTKIGKTFKLL